MLNLRKQKFKADTFDLYGYMLKVYLKEEKDPFDWKASELKGIN